MEDTFYKYHVFVCVNQREELSACDDFDTAKIRNYLKQQMKEKNLYGEGKVRISQSGCLGRCLKGPVLVVYPQAIWYTYVDHHDIDEIIESHLINDKIVERLHIDADNPSI